MARFRKDTLYPGTYRLADGRSVTFTPEKVRHLARRAREMLEAGLQVPVSWDHQPVGALTEDERRAQKVRNCLGHVEAADLSPEGYLVTEWEVPVPSDAERVPAVRFASPQITEDFVDGTGRLWPGESITHVAVTPRPVQHRQRPVEPVALGLGRGKRSYCLSLGDYEMADDSDDKKKGGDGEGETGKGADFTNLVEALRAKGINVPDEVHDLTTLVIAVKASGGGAPAPEAPDDDLDAELEGGPGGAAQPPGPVMMSLDAQKALRDRVLKNERHALQRRINKLFLSGRIQKELRDGLVEQARTVNLGLDAEGRVRPHRLIAQVQAYEQLAPGRFGVGGGRRAAALSLDADDDLVEVGPPDARPGDSPEAAAAAVKAYEEMLAR